jgi:hypothetical protein
MITHLKGNLAPSIIRNWLRVLENRSGVEIFQINETFDFATLEDFAVRMGNRAKVAGRACSSGAGDFNQSALVGLSKASLPTSRIVKKLAGSSTGEPELWDENEVTILPCHSRSGRNTGYGRVAQCR